MTVNNFFSLTYNNSDVTMMATVTMIMMIMMLIILTVSSMLLQSFLTLKSQLCNNLIHEILDSNQQPLCEP